MTLRDTNILLRYASTTNPAFATVDTAINSLLASGEVLCVVPQNVYEFWATATRPTASNGLGLSIKECQVQVARVKRLCRFLPDLPTLFAEWWSAPRKLVHPKWESLGRISHGGTHEKAKDRRRGSASAARNRP